MNGIKSSLDVKQRHVSKSLQNTRMHYERSLYSSSATLIIVPLALLEHWYEQIMRHLNLLYFSTDGDIRGIVYLDGLGDIVDIEAPISRLMIQQQATANHKMETSPQILASYSIVVTTMERCLLEQKMARSRASQQSEKDGRDTRSNLQQIRWLRLIVDEGHDLGKLKYDFSATIAVSSSSSSHPTSSSSSPAPLNTATTSSSSSNNNNNNNNNIFLAAHYISRLAAERRWIMSGTPTTGAFSEIGLMQLFQLLCFLRHPAYFTDHDWKNLETNEKNWIREIVKPCLEQDSVAWEKVTSLLKDIMVRHTKVSRKYALFP
jgi:hypothetical protein